MRADTPGAMSFTGSSAAPSWEENAICEFMRQALPRRG